MRTIVLVLAAILLAAGAGAAGDACGVPECCGEPQACTAPECCTQCGCQSCCQKVCKLVCEIKEVKKTVWEVKCTDFCAPLPSLGRCCCESCGGCEAECPAGAACGGCEGCGKCCDPCASLWKCLVPPKCGPVRTKKELVKKEITCKVPVYKCVVVCCGSCPGDCGFCDCRSDGEQAAPATRAADTPVAVPEPPKPAEKTTLKPAPLPPVVGASYKK